MSMSADSILKKFGERVRKLRKSQGYSQESFEVDCGLDRTYLDGIERGESNVALKNKQVIAKSLEVSVSELTKEM